MKASLILLAVAAIIVQNIFLHRKQALIVAQIDDLNTAIDSVSTKLDTLKTDVDTVLAELQTANQNPAVDLSGSIAKLQAVSTKLDGITAEFAPASAAPQSTSASA